MPCPNPVACVGVDTPVLNLSSETPDRLKFFGYTFFGDQWGLCIRDSPELAALCDLPFPSNPPAPVLALSNPQTCTVPCGGVPVSYTAAAGSFAAFGQDRADALAFEFACLVAQIICDGGPFTIFTNTPQTCTVPCALGNSVVTMPVGVASGLSQAQADAAAFNLACAVAALLCDQNPVPPGIPPFGGAGLPPGPVFYFTNAPQSCNFNCADGASVFTHFISGGLFYAESPSIANSIAQSFACNPNTFTIACLSGIETDTCLEEVYVDQITVSGFSSPTWAFVSGSLPIGVSFSNGFVAGVPQETGVFNFTIRATQGNDYVERSYTLNVRAITTNALTDGTQNTPYAAALTETGFGTSATWSVISGSLPPGITLHPVTGVLSGTPTATGTFNFIVQLSE